MLVALRQVGQITSPVPGALSDIFKTLNGQCATNAGYVDSVIIKRFQEMDISTGE